MAVIDVSSFTGMRTAVAGHLLENNESQYAANMDLENGDIIPYNIPVKVLEASGVVRSVWRHDLRSLGMEQTWRLFYERRHFVESPIAQDQYGRLYMSNDDTGGLSYMDKDGTEYRLGVKRPSTMPVIGEKENRGGAVLFESSTHSFYFVDQTLGSCPRLTAGQKVSFTGTVPSEITENTEYYIVTPLLRTDGTFSYQIGSSKGQAINVSTTTSYAHCSVAFEGEQTRAYVVTLVDEFGAESAPSLAATVDTDISAKHTVTFNLGQYSGGSANGYAAISIWRIYRTATGTESGTDYYYVGEQTITQDTFVDDKLDSELSEPLPSLDWLEPTDDMKHLVILPHGIMAAHNDHEVCFSGEYFPYSWAVKNKYTLFGNIQGIAVSQNTCFALTDSYVHALTVSGGLDNVYVTTLDGFSPCLSADGVVSSQIGVLFPAPDGLYRVVEGSSAPENLTKGIISEREWKALNPSSFTAAMYGLVYVAMYEAKDGTKGTLLLSFTGSGQAVMRMLRIHGTCLQVTPADRNIFYVQSFERSNVSVLKQLFPNTDTPTAARWRSKEYVFPTPINMSACIVEDNTFDSSDYVEEERNITFSGQPLGSEMCGEIPFGGEDSDAFTKGSVSGTVLRVYADDKLRATLNIIHGKFMRLPRGFAARRWYFEIDTLSTIRRVAIGTNIEELRYGQ